ncbi:MAG: hypothetical protein WDN76_05170 [Alphaproteobacteria bacterium]
MTTELLGVDVGGVLIDRIRADGSDTSFLSERFLETPAVEDAFDTLVRLGRERFGQGICIVSKCGPRTEDKTRLWLAQHRLLDMLDLDEQALHFCRKRPDKAPICKRLGVTHFIDDRMDVLVHLTSVRYKILFGPQDIGVNAKGAVRARTWEEVADRLL